MAFSNVPQEAITNPFCFPCFMYLLVILPILKQIPILVSPLNFKDIIYKHNTAVLCIFCTLYLEGSNFSFERGTKRICLSVHFLHFSFL